MRRGEPPSLYPHRQPPQPHQHPSGGVTFEHHRRALALTSARIDQSPRVLRGHHGCLRAENLPRPPPLLGRGKEEKKESFETSTPRPELQHNCPLRRSSRGCKMGTVTVRYYSENHITAAMSIEVKSRTSKIKVRSQPGRSVGGRKVAHRSP